MVIFIEYLFYIIFSPKKYKFMSGIETSKTDETIIDRLNDKKGTAMICVHLIPMVLLMASLGIYQEMKEVKTPTIFYLITVGIGLFMIVVLCEILLGKTIGKSLSEKSGIVLGVILIILGVTLFIGIPIIIYSSEKNKKHEIIINIIFSNNTKGEPK